jgi:phosphate transport system substrate-binding protein
MNNQKTSVKLKAWFWFNNLLLAAVILSLLSFTGCDNSVNDNNVFHIDNLTIENYPSVDGSTSTEPLQVLIACKLFDIKYAWVYMSFWFEYPYHLMPDCDLKPEIGRFIIEHIHHSGTHTSFVNLIEKNVDLILTARSASPDEIFLADSLDITLIETPVALDAFIFLVNINNPVNSLTTKQIQDIYTGRITNWNEVGGPDTAISPYQRERNSGSQELMESLIMKDLTMIDLPDMIIYGMVGLINQIEYDRQGLGYSVNYYTQYMIRSDSVKLIAVDGVYPDRNNIKNKEYGYTANVYAVIREDMEKTSPAYQLFELLSTTAGQGVINESGYISYY